MKDAFDRELRAALQGEPIPLPQEVAQNTEHLLAQLPPHPPRHCPARLVVCLVLLLVGPLFIRHCFR